MSGARSERFMSSDGTTGWYAVSPDGSRIDGDDEPWAGPRAGTTIRLMGEDSVEVPLWGEDGLIFDDAEELAEHWGLSTELVSDLVVWAAAWQSRSGEPDHDRAAVELVRRLADELDHDYDIVFKP